ncbi:MAG: NAD(+)/NADH kinase, partial [Chloroflexota bacterium]
MRGPLNSVAVLFNPNVADARELAHALSTLVELRGIAVAICEGETEEQMSAAIPPATDLLITLGGDGTLLRTAHFAAAREIPILGVNLGKLGFLCDIGPNRALEDVPGYLEGHYEVEQRMMLKVIHYRKGKALSAKHALNDAVVGHASVASIIRVHASVNRN